MFVINYVVVNLILLSKRSLRLFLEKERLNKTKARQAAKKCGSAAVDLMPDKCLCKIKQAYLLSKVLILFSLSTRKILHKHLSPSKGI